MTVDGEQLRTCQVNAGVMDSVDTTDLTMEQDAKRGEAGQTCVICFDRVRLLPMHGFTSLEAGVSECREEATTDGEIFEKRPIAFLSCGHAFHLDCISNAFYHSRALNCPSCRLTQCGDWSYLSRDYINDAYDDGLGHMPAVTHVFYASSSESEYEMEEFDNHDEPLHESANVQAEAPRNQLMPILERRSRRIIFDQTAEEDGSSIEELSQINTNFLTKIAEEQRDRIQSLRDAANEEMELVTEIEWSTGANGIIYHPEVDVLNDKLTEINEILAWTFNPSNDLLRLPIVLKFIEHRVQATQSQLTLLQNSESHLDPSLELSLSRRIGRLCYIFDDLRRLAPATSR